MSEIINRYKLLIYLLKCELNNTKPDKSIFSEIDNAELKKLSRFHGVASMAASALLSADDEGIINPEIRKEWHYTHCRAMGRDVLLKEETDRICKAFADAGIHYVKLKGIVISDYYPKPGMREMSDVDLLIDNDRMKKAGEILESFDYKATAIDQSNHDVFKKPPMLCFEIHEELFTDYHSEFYKYYIDCRKKLIKGENYELKFSDDDFYIYNISHSCKHLHDAGVGLRALTDIYVLQNKFSLNRAYIDRELKTLGIDGDEKILTSLSKKLFSAPVNTEFPELSEQEEKVLVFLLKSGANGTIEQSIKNQMSEKMYEEDYDVSKGKRLYIKSRLFPKPEAYKKSHPFFYRHKAARPFLVFVRLWDSIFKNKGRLKNELKSLREVSDKND